MNEGSRKRAGTAETRVGEDDQAGRTFLVPVGIGLLSLAVMFAVAWANNLPVRDPDARYVGSPLGVIGVVALVFLMADVLPRAVRMRRDEGIGAFAATAAVLRERWLGRRGAIVVVCLLSAYASYLAYRNLKSYVPFISDANHDLGLLELERSLFFGSDPTTLVQTLLGTGVVAHLLSLVYLAFLTFVPVSLAVALIWSSRLAAGIWYVTALSLTWMLGALSYYVLPALGPAYAAPGLVSHLPETGVGRLQQTLLEHRLEVLADPVATSAVQSIAAFASLHIAVVFAAALTAHLLQLARPLRIGLWTFLGLTALATLYFGWHYVVDDVAGLAIGGFAVYAAAKLTAASWPPVTGRPALAQRRARTT